MMGESKRNALGKGTAMLALLAVMWSGGSLDRSDDSQADNGEEPTPLSICLVYPERCEILF